MIELIRYKSHQLSNPSSLFNKLQFGDIENRDYFYQVCRDASKSETTIHILQYNELVLGFIALSFQCFGKKNKKKYLNIDYLFVCEPYRKKPQNYLDDTKVSDYLVQIAISIAQELKEIVPIYVISAEPAHRDIVKLYKDNDFRELQGYDKNVLYLKI